MALPGTVDLALAEAIVANARADVLVAREITPEAAALFAARRKNMRPLAAPPPEPERLGLRQVGGGFLVQEPDRFLVPRDQWRVVTKAVPDEGAWRDLELAWRVCGRTSSNAVVLAKGGVAYGIGCGQQNRVDAAAIAGRRADGRAAGGAAASDAFFPFRDGLDAVRRCGGGRRRPAGRLAQGRRDRRRRRRARHRHGDDRRAALPPLSRAAAAPRGGGARLTWRRAEPTASPVTATVLDGEALAARIRAEVAAEVAELAAAGVVPGLGTILVGDDGPSARYVARKHADCAEVGIASIHQHLPAETTQEELEAVLRSFNGDPAVDAYLLQLPLPAHLDEEAALLAVDPEKDVDGLHPVNLGRLVMGAPGPLPCTPAGIVELLAAHEVPVEGRHVVVIGRGLTIGRPLALLLALKRPGCNAAVTVVHTGVASLADYLLQADVVVAAAGSPGLVTAEMVRPGAAVVAAGVSWDGRRVLSDVADEVAEVAGWLSPRIGGVGPMTRAMLLRNALRAARRRLPPA